MVELYFADLALLCDQRSDSQSRGCKNAHQRSEQGIEEQGPGQGLLGEAKEVASFFEFQKASFEEAEGEHLLTVKGRGEVFHYHGGGDE